MNRLLRVVAPLLMLVISAVASAEEAPQFTLPGADGKPVSLADLKGKVVYVDFWASWCGPCRQSFPWMNELQANFGNQGLVVVAINVDQERALADKFMEAMKPNFTVAFDSKGTVAELYKVQGMPSSYIIDRQGNIRSRHIGFREKEIALVDSEIRSLLSH